MCLVNFLAWNIVTYEHMGLRQVGPMTADQYMVQWGGGGGTPSSSSCIYLMLIKELFTR